MYYTTHPSKSMKVPAAHDWSCLSCAAAFAIAPAPATVLCVSRLKSATRLKTTDATGVSAATFTNPVVCINSPDPGVLGSADGGFVAVTSSGGRIASDVFPLRSSPNLVDWRLETAIFPRDTHPRWASPPFYAPEIHGPISGTGKARFWAVYDATENATGAMVVGAAWAKSPTGPFTDLGKPLRRVYEPHAPPSSHPGSAIDATLYHNRSDGRVYLLWKKPVLFVRSRCRSCYPLQALPPRCGSQTHPLRC